MQLEIRPEPGAVARAGAELVAARLAEAIAARGEAHLAVGGGPLTWRLLVALGEAGLDWDRVQVWQTHERLAPEGHADRHLTGLAAAVPPAAVLHPIAVTHPDTYQCARAYAAILPEPLDVVVLTLAVDGHVASLIPGDPVVNEEQAPVGVTLPHRGRRRVTLSLVPLNRARARLVLACGANLRETARGMLAQDREIVAGRLTHDDTWLMLDGAAAGE